MFGGLFDVETQRLRQRLGLLYEREGCRFKRTDQIVNNSTTLVNVTDLGFSLKPREVLSFKYVIFYNSNTGSDIKCTISAPTGAFLLYSPTGGTSIGPGETSVSNTAANVANTVIFVFGGLGANGYTAASNTANARVAEITGVVRNGGFSGNLNLQFAQQVATLSNTAILAHSYVQTTF